MNIFLQYIDTNGKKSVNVVIRTVEREIFTETFYTSMFETNVMDYKLMILQFHNICAQQSYLHNIEFQLHPGDSSDTKINGIFHPS
jgi:hypothetical protein